MLNNDNDDNAKNYKSKFSLFTDTELTWQLNPEIATFPWNFSFVLVKYW